MVMMMMNSHKFSSFSSVLTAKKLFDLNFRLLFSYMDV